MNATWGSGVFTTNIGEERKKFGAGEGKKKKREILGSPPFGPPTTRGSPTPSGPSLSGPLPPGHPTLRAPPPLEPPTLRSPLPRGLDFPTFSTLLGLIQKVISTPEGFLQFYSVFLFSRFF